VNIVDAEGVPSTIDFVRADGGAVRLAALVPSKLQATLIDPNTTVSEKVGLPVGYSQMTRITDAVTDKPATGDDVALLYSPDQKGLAFWSLGQTVGSPYRSVDALNDLDIAVKDVVDIPGKHTDLKILESASDYNGFYLLDLTKRAAYPLPTKGPGYTLSVAPDGGRFWAFFQGMNDFASTSLDNVHPIPSLVASLPVTALYDIERADKTRAALVMHGTDVPQYSQPTDPAVTLFDALEPNSADTRFFGGLLLGGL
jgi:hypothetical protein